MKRPVIKRSAVINRVAVTAPDTYIKTEVSFDNGKVCMLTGQSCTPGYYVSAEPVVNGTVTAGSGTRSLIKDATRFSAKALADLVASAVSHPKYDAVVGQVLAKNRLALAS